MGDCVLIASLPPEAPGTAELEEPCVQLEFSGFVCHVGGASIGATLEQGGIPGLLQPEARIALEMALNSRIYLIEGSCVTSRSEVAMETCA